MADFELQQELQRFTTQFVDRVTQATEILEQRARPSVRDDALRKNLLYVSSAMEITTGPFPEVNLLDMVVFVRLSRAILERHWIPKVYGDLGNDLAEVFARSDDEIGAIAARSLNPSQRAELVSLVEVWLAENPDQIRVEGIRLADFSAMAGIAAADRALKAKGLLASVKTATHAANQALMLTERGMFLIHRLPSVWRLQARLGAREMMGDAITQLTVGAEAPIVRTRVAAQRIARRGLMLAGIAGGVGLLAWTIRSALR